MRALRRTVLAAALAVALAIAAVPARARAQGLDLGSLEGLAVAAAYAVPSAACLLAITVNGAHLAYDQGAPAPWRTTGYVAGGADLVVGVVVLAVDGDTTRGVILGVIPIVLGAASITTATFVKKPDDIVGPVSGLRLAPFVAHDAGGLVLGGTF